MVKSLPAMQETQVRSLGWEDPMKKEIATTPVLLPGKFHGPRRLVGYSPWGHKELDMTEQLHFLLIICQALVKCRTLNTICPFVQ